MYLTGPSVEDISHLRNSVRHSSSLFISLRVLSCRSVLDQVVFASNLSPLPYSSLIVISKLVGLNLCLSRSCSALTWNHCGTAHVPTLSSLRKRSRYDCHWALEIGVRISEAFTMTVNASESQWTVGHRGLSHAAVTAWTLASFQELGWGSARRNAKPP